MEHEAVPTVLPLLDQPRALPPDLERPELLGDLRRCDERLGVVVGDVLGVGGDDDPHRLHTGRVAGAGL